MCATIATNAELPAAELAHRRPLPPPEASELLGPSPLPRPEETPQVHLAIEGASATYPIRGQLLWLGMRWFPSSHAWMGMISASSADQLLSEHPLKVLVKVPVEPVPTEGEAVVVEAAAEHEDEPCACRCPRCGNHTLTLGRQDGRPGQTSCRSCDARPQGEVRRWPDIDLEVWLRREKKERAREAEAF